MKSYEILDIGADDPFCIVDIEDDGNFESNLREAIENCSYIGEGSILVAREIRRPTERELEIGSKASEILKEILSNDLD